jgi:hypothetical protein
MIETEGARVHLLVLVTVARLRSALEHDPVVLVRELLRVLAITDLIRVSVHPKLPFVHDATSVVAFHVLQQNGDRDLASVRREGDDPMAIDHRICLR